MDNCLPSGAVEAAAHLAWALIAFAAFWLGVGCSRQICQATIDRLQKLVSTLEQQLCKTEDELDDARYDRDLE